MAKEGAVKCQRIGCDAFFSFDNNPEESCKYHSGHIPKVDGLRSLKQVTTSDVSCPTIVQTSCVVGDAQSDSFVQPLFHDGGKEWSCCKQRSHDFGLFLSLPGCTTGKHSSEKPQTKAAPSPNHKPIQVASTGNPALAAAKAACSRCRQGFFCSDHGVQPTEKTSTKKTPIPLKTAPLQAPIQKPGAQIKKAASPKVIDLNTKQVCKHKGCGNTFTEKENYSTACNFHPGPAVFHDRQKGWGCCDVHVKDFDEFLMIPPCTKGWHDANAGDS